MPPWRCNRQVIASVPRGGADDIDRAVKAASEAFPGWSRVIPRERGRMLQKIADEAEVIRMANDSHYGLAAYVWTHDIGRALRAAHAIEAGWAQVNQGLGQTPGHSYGGIKQSGMGREFSLEGMLDSFTQKKNVTLNLNTPSH